MRITGAKRKLVLTPEMREKALIFMQGMATAAKLMQAERKEA